MREACLKFRSLLIDAVSIDPFNFITLPSLCVGTFRAKFLVETWSGKRFIDQDQRETVFKRNGVFYTADGKTVDPDDFAQMEFLSTPIAQVANSTDQYSQVSIQWLEWIRQTEDPDVQHALRYGEKKLGVYRLDGFSAKTRTAYEFHGCKFHRHGCGDKSQSEITQNRSNCY